MTRVPAALLPERIPADPERMARRFASRVSGQATRDLGNPNPTEGELVSTVQQTIDVAVPLQTAYNQWTQFESFPQFMAGVEQVHQQTDRMTHWVTRIGGVTREFDAEITEQEPDRRIAWQTIDGPQQRGVVAFQPLDEAHTRLMLQMDFEPEGVTEQVSDKLGFVERRVRGDLERFKEFIESRGTETGAWRGEVDPLSEAAGPDLDYEQPGNVYQEPTDPPRGL